MPSDVASNDGMESEEFDMIMDVVQTRISGDRGMAEAAAAVEEKQAKEARGSVLENGHMPATTELAPTGAPTGGEGAADGVPEDQVQGFGQARLAEEERMQRKILTHANDGPVDGLGQARLAEERMKRKILTHANDGPVDGLGQARLAEERMQSKIQDVQEGTNGAEYLGGLGKAKLAEEQVKRKVQSHSSYPQGVNVLDYALDVVDAPRTGSPNEVLVGEGRPMQPPELSCDRSMIATRPAVPGAIPIGGNDHMQNEMLDDDIEAAGQEGAGTENRSLAVANLIEDDAEPKPDLPQAEDIALETARKREKERRRFKTNILLGVIFLIVLIMIFVAVLVPSKEEETLDPTSVPTQNPSSSPTQAPTSLKGHVLNLLPDETIFALDDPSSSQARAFQWLIEDSQLPFLSEERIIQRFALATFFMASSGADWTSNENWLNYSVHECQWYNRPDYALKTFISMQYPGFIKEMFPLTEPPPTRCDDEGLYQHLWLDHNHLVGTVPREFYLLTSLRTFSFLLNGLQGEISSHIGDLSSIEGLSLDHIKSGSTLPTTIGLLNKTLRVFGCDGCDLQGSIPTELWQLTNLETLVLNRNPGLHGTIPPSISNFKKLRWFTNSESGLSGTIPTEIGQLGESLEYMSWGDNSFTGTLPSTLGLLTHCTLLALNGNSFEGTIPSEVGAMSLLELLSLRENLLTGTLATQIGKLTNLELSLSLFGNELSGTIPTELSNLVSVEHLLLQGNRFNGRIPSEFGRLSGASLILLQNNSLSGMVPEELSILQHSLFGIDIKGNPLLSGTIPDGLCNINGTCVGSSVNPCFGDPGLNSDCTDQLCGCQCSSCLAN